MEKYGVEVDDQAKQASAEEKPKCPDCGSTLLPPQESNVPRCPKCGTKPWEPKAP